MRRYEPRSWRSSVLGTLLLLVAIAIGARVVYGLLVPLVPVAGAVVVLLAVYGLLFRGRR